MNRQIDMSENITFRQLCWWAVITTVDFMLCYFAVQVFTCLKYFIDSFHIDNITDSTANTTKDNGTFIFFVNKQVML